MILRYLICVFVREGDLGRFRGIERELTKQGSGISDIGSGLIDGERGRMLTYSHLCLDFSEGRKRLEDARRLLRERGLTEAEGNFYFNNYSLKSA